MELQTTTQTQIQTAAEIPAELIQMHKKGQYPLGTILPNQLMKQIKPIAVAKLSHWMLKLCKIEEQTMYAAKIGAFINPKGDKISIQEDFNTLLEFVQSCNLTGPEFMLALNLVSSEQLTDINNEPIKYFRDINIANFNLYVSAYKRYRDQSKEFEKGFKIVQDFLEIPPPEPTPEEKLATAKKWWIEDFKIFKAEGRLRGGTKFYDLISPMIENVNRKWLEKLLETYTPTKTTGSISIGKTEKPKVYEQNLLAYFQSQMVFAYIKKMKLNEVDQDAWIEHWENLYKKLQDESI